MTSHPSPAQEQERWRVIVRDLQAKFTLAQIATEVGVTERQVANWRTGDRPKGLVAVRLYLFHWRRCCDAQPVDLYRSTL